MSDKPRKPDLLHDRIAFVMGGTYGHAYLEPEYSIDRVRLTPTRDYMLSPETPAPIAVAFESDGTGRPEGYVLRDRLITVDLSVVVGTIDEIVNKIREALIRGFQQIAIDTVGGPHSSRAQEFWQGNIEFNARCNQQEGPWPKFYPIGPPGSELPLQPAPEPAPEADHAG